MCAAKAASASAGLACRRQRPRRRARRPAVAGAAVASAARPPLGAAIHAVDAELAEVLEVRLQVVAGHQRAAGAPGATPSSRSRRSRMRPATSALDISGTASSAVVADERDGVGLDLEPGVGPGDVVGDDEDRRPCAAAWRRRGRATSCVSAAKPMSTGRPVARDGSRPRSARMSVVRTSGSDQRAVGLGDLLRRRPSAACSRRPPPPSRRRRRRRRGPSPRACMSAALRTRTTSTPAGGSRCVGPVTSTTAAPRRAASCATA